MTKKILVTIGAVVFLYIVYWFLSPLFINVTLDEELPGATDTSAPFIQDNFLTMDTDTKTDLEKQTTEMVDKVMDKDEVMPVDGPIVIGRANMLPRAHEVEGTALLVQSGEETYLRFEDLKTINGPALYIYLSSDLSDNDIVDLGPIKATRGNVNYLVPPNTDLDKYKNVMIWCRPFGVLFSYAQF